MSFERPEDFLDDDRRIVEDYGFWAFVDSSPGAWSSYNRNPWPEERGEQCLAANSRAERCSKFVGPDAPFCGFHLQRAWDALCAMVVRSEYRAIGARMQRELEAIADARQLDKSLLHDLAKAAKALPERVYFFAAQHAVKIGRSVNPEARVKTLGTAKTPEGVDVRAGSLLGTIPGSSRVEWHLHQRFRPHRLVGEWFSLEPIRADIDALLAERQEAAA